MGIAGSSRSAWVIGIGVGLAAVACAPKPQPAEPLPPTGLPPHVFDHPRLDQIADHPDRYVGKTLAIDVLDPITAADSAGFWGTDERADAAVVLAPASFKLADAKRYDHPLDRVLQAPVRVRAEVIRDDDPRPGGLETAEKPWYVLRVIDSEPLDLGAPIVLTAAQAASPDESLDRKFVAVPGVPTRGFERSDIGKIWISGGEYRAGSLAAGPAGTTAGILHVQQGRRYGHLGMYQAELITPIAPQPQPQPPNQ